jgi:hypothetical protein
MGLDAQIVKILCGAQGMVILFFFKAIGTLFM